MTPEYQDITIRCADCAESFYWTASEQQFYASRELSRPRRCRACRAIRRAERDTYEART